MALSYGEKSYSSWAKALSEEIGRTVSKQAIFKRMKPCWVLLVKQLVERVLQKHLVATNHKPQNHLFNNIYLQDSTSLALPDFMCNFFPGNYSRGKQKAVAKINTIINAITGLCISFSIDSYTKAEQQLSMNILNIAKAGDLVIRDLGYYVLDIFQQINDKGIFFISRQLYQTNIFNPTSGKKLSMKRLFKNKAFIDIVVLCGNKQNLPVRLVAFRLNSRQVAERVRKARKNRDKRLKHSAQYYENLKYLTFITNIEKSVCTSEQIAEFYRLRWQIEILFKSWKSGIKIETLIPKAQCRLERIEAVIYMMMLYITWFEQEIKQPIYIEVVEKRSPDISPIRLAAYVLRNLRYFLNSRLLKSDLDNIQYYCRYEPRARINAGQRLRNLLDQFG